MDDLMEDSKHSVLGGDPWLSSHSSHLNSAPESPTTVQLQCCTSNSSFNNNDNHDASSHDHNHNNSCRNHNIDLYQKTKTTETIPSKDNCDDNCNVNNDNCCQFHHQSLQQVSKQNNGNTNSTLNNCKNRIKNQYHHQPNQSTSNSNSSNTISKSSSSLQHGRDPLLSSSHHISLDSHNQIDGLEPPSQHYHDNLNDNDHVDDQVSVDLSSDIMNDSLSLISSTPNESILLSSNSLDINIQ